MEIIGITGGTGSGKSIVSNQLKKYNCFIIDCDEIAHKIILKGQKAYDEIVHFFGREILDCNGEILRKKLGNIVFNDNEKLEILNNCTHKYIIEEINKKINFAINREKFKKIVIDAPLIIETNIYKMCDSIWLIYCDENTRAKRIVLRDNISYDLAIKRINSQKNFNEYKKYSNFIIDNSKDINFLNEQIEKIFNYKIGER